MTTESVATETKIAKSIPGLHDLLLSLGSLRGHQDLDRVANAAENALVPINQGISAIGEMLWRIADADPNSFELEDRTLHGIGVLLVHLAEFSEQVQFIGRNATFAAHDDRAKW